MKAPNECSNIEDIRSELDRIDRHYRCLENDLDTLKLHQSLKRAKQKSTTKV